MPLKLKLEFYDSICRWCRSCELVCSLLHEGTCSPALSRITIAIDQFNAEVSIVDASTYPSWTGAYASPLKPVLAWVQANWQYRQWLFPDPTTDVYAWSAAGGEVPEVHLQPHRPDHGIICRLSPELLLPIDLYAGLNVIVTRYVGVRVYEKMLLPIAVGLLVSHGIFCFVDMAVTPFASEGSGWGIFQEG